MKEVKGQLDRYFETSLIFPQDDASFAVAMGSWFFGVHDPWGTPHFPRFTIHGPNYVIDLMSAGPDKRPGSADDFVAETFRHPYFALPQRMIGDILTAHKVFPPDEASFKTLLSANGILLDSLPDPWGKPYRAVVNTFQANRSISIHSAGPDGKFETPDDVQVAFFWGDYFQREREQISAALQQVPAPPKTVEEFRAALKNAGIDIDAYRDAWGRPYRLTTETTARFNDRRATSAVQIYGAAPVQRTEVTPVTQHLLLFSLVSDGPDGIEGGYDDFSIATFPVILSELSAQPVPAAPGLIGAAPAANAGFLAGIVTDPTGARVPGAHLVLNGPNNATSAIDSDAAGEFRFTVPAGEYAFSASLKGFQTYKLLRIPIAEGKTVTLTVQLQVGTASETVTVNASVLPMNASTAMSVQVMAAASSSTYTPRVRDYFPETLLWIPEQLTNSDGLATAEFTMADSVTNWKVAAVASTLDGRIVEAETDLRSFQPFFADFNPPQSLTEGDQVELPVSLRNYTKSAVKTQITFQPGDGVKVNGAAKADAAIPADRSSNISFTVRAEHARDKSVQRIVAKTTGPGDAIERSFRIRPDGQEVSHSSADLLAGPLSFTLNVPPNAIPGATRAELRLYPNVASLLAEGATAIAHMPRSCAEQTVSYGYANWIAWRFAQAAAAGDAETQKRTLAAVHEAADALDSFLAK